MSMKTRITASLLLLLVAPPVLHAQVRNDTDGTNAGNGITTGDDSVFIGYDAGRHADTGTQNVIIGSQAAIGGLNTSLSEIIGVGGASLLSGQGFNGSQSVIIGYRAAWQAPNSAAGNVIIGSEAGLYNQASDQVFVGTEAGQNNTTGTDNTFIGRRAGRNNTTGSSNTLVGRLSGNAILSGDNNTVFGSHAYSLTALNADAGNSFNNTSIGTYSGRNLGTDTQVWNHTFVGSYAGNTTDTGQANTLLGSLAGTKNREGDFNTMIGFIAGYNNNRAGGSTGHRNTYFGMASGMSNRNGNDNVILGALADTGKWESVNTATVNALASGEDNFSIQSHAAQINNNVSQSVAIGTLSATLANDSVTIGYSADGAAAQTIAMGSGTTATHAGAIVLGYQAASHGANIAVLGNSTTTAIDPGADATTALGSATHRYQTVHAETILTQANTSSAATIDLHADAASENNDRWRLAAANGADISFASFATGAYVTGLSLSNTGDLTVAGEVSLNSDARLKTRVKTIPNAQKRIQRLKGRQYEWKPGLGRDSNTHFGLIAQDVQQVFPHLVSQHPDGTLSVKYLALVPVLLEAIKEQQKTIEAQDHRIARLKTRSPMKMIQEIQALLSLLDHSFPSAQ